MSFIKKLAKGFVRSGVNQVGRDGGRVISNKIYGDRHSIPIRNTGNRPNLNLKQSFVEEDFSDQILPSDRGDFKYQFFSSKWYMYFFMLIGCIILYPISWLYFLLGFFKYKNKKTITLVGTELKNVIKVDRRYKSGTRIDTHLISSRREFPANDAEMQLNKNKAWIYLSILILFWIIFPGMLFLMDVFPTFN